MTTRRASMFNRRQLLSAVGLGSGSLLLPSLLGRRAKAAEPPKRLVIFSSDFGCVHDNWIMRPPEVPTGDFTFPLDDPDPSSFSTILAPLHAHRSKLLVVEGLAQLSAYIGSPYTSPHAASSSGALTGTEHIITGVDECVPTGPSVDQIIAAAVKKPGQIASLQYGSPRFRYDEGAVRMPAEEDPAEAFERLFGESSSRGTVDPVAAERGSVLDFVADEYDAVAPRLGSEDQKKLEAHRDLIRDIEVGLASAAQCEEAALAEGAAYKQFAQLTALALSCDLTRVVNYHLPRPGPAECGLPSGTNIHQDLAHHEGGDVGKAGMTKFYRTCGERFRAFVDAVAAVPDLFEHTVLAWVTEHGNGEHDLRGIPYVLAGSCGGALQTGRYVRYASSLSFVRSGKSKTSGPGHNRMLVSLCHAMGLDQVDSIGMANVDDGKGGTIDLSGRLDELFA
jgi:hypothetical protein